MPERSEEDKMVILFLHIGKLGHFKNNLECIKMILGPIVPQNSDKSAANGGILIKAIQETKKAILMTRHAD